MLGPLLVASITRTGAFKAVVMTPGSASNDPYAGVVAANRAVQTLLQ